MNTREIEGRRMVVELVRLGGRFEQADAKKDYPTMGRIERRLMLIINRNPEVWCEPFFVRGRNVIRKIAGREPVAV